MEPFVLSVSKAGVRAAEMGFDLRNPELFSAVFEPLAVFLGEVGGGEAFETTAGLQSNRGDEVGIAVDRFLFRGFDLGKLSLETFIELEIGARVGESFGPSLGMASSRRVMTGIARDERGVHFGFRIETMMKEFELPYVPHTPYLVDAWLMFSQLWLEDQLGLRLKEVKKLVEQHIGPSLREATPRIEAGELSLAPLAEELEKRYRISRDLSAALIQLPDWLKDGGAARLEALRKADRERQN